MDASTKRMCSLLEKVPMMGVLMFWMKQFDDDEVLYVQMFGDERVDQYEVLR